MQDERLLVVDVLLADVVDLYGAEVQLHYDPAQLAVQDANPRLPGVQITPGSFLASEDRFVVANIVDTEAGDINLAVTLLKPAPPVSGEGVLATIAFEVLGAGPYAVEVVNAQLVSSELDPMSMTTEDWYLSGVEPGGPEQASAPQPISPRVWWGVALFSALIALAFFALLLLRQAEGVTPNLSPTLRRRMPGGAFLSSRSSALLARQGQQAMDRGDTQKAYELFSQAVEFDPSNAEAWLGKGLMAQHNTEKRICFERVLALDPDNAMAKAELQQIQ